MANCGRTRAGAKSREVNPNAAATPSAPRSDKSSGAALKSKIIRASRMPVLPKEDTKIVVRPRAAGISQDELSISQDALCPNSWWPSIMVASTPRRENADRYARIKQIRISGKIHDL
ncbi:hypothetical protein HPB49_006185 [Dermacentor silvarum]|uniref:Uncharacterized protein n=1 Tax=Dermacentor silvarum TaxID=543639 RepID=A0ACB8CVH7_DERSI|nr:hypothetical protein HPB49_006185 [Dermacentor silvarum]